jgi:hypothetical protein
LSYCHPINTNTLAVILCVMLQEREYYNSASKNGDGNLRYVYLYVHTYIHTHTYIHNTYIHTYTHIHSYIHTYVLTYIHTYLRTYIHTYTHIHIQVFLNTLELGYNVMKGTEYFVSL